MGERVERVCVRWNFCRLSRRERGGGERERGERGGVERGEGRGERGEGGGERGEGRERGEIGFQQTIVTSSSCGGEMF